MKHFNRKIKNALFILVVCLFAFIGFSKAGVIFSDNNNVITISTTKKNFDPNNYVAAMKTFVDSKEQGTTTNNETKTSVSTTTTTITTTLITTKEDVELTFEGKSVAEVGETLNKTLGGILAGTGETFARLSMEKGMDPYLLAAISAHETGNGTSSAANKKYNFGGIMCSGGLCSYPSLYDGIESYINLVYKNYYSQGLTTAEAMNKKYAQSSSWATKVNSWYDTLKNK